MQIFKKQGMHILDKATWQCVNRNFKNDPPCRTIGKIYASTAVVVLLWQKESLVESYSNIPLR